MKKHYILFVVFHVFLTFNLSAQNHPEYLISKLQPIKDESGKTIKQFTTLKTGIDSIRVSFMIDLEATKFKCSVILKTKQNTETGIYFDMTEKANVEGLYKKTGTICFDNDTKSISFEIRYSPALNEIRYIWINNNQKSQTASIATVLNSFQLNMPFPDLTLRRLDGEKITKKDIEGKYVIINLWFVYCSNCRKEIPLLNKLAEKFANNRNVIFVAISVDQQIKVWEDYLKMNSFNYLQTRCDPDSISKIYKGGYPLSLIVNPKGIIKYNSYEGANDKIDIEIERELDKIMKGN